MKFKWQLLPKALFLNLVANRGSGLREKYQINVFVMLPGRQHLALRFDNRCVGLVVPDFAKGTRRNRTFETRKKKQW